MPEQETRKVFVVSTLMNGMVGFTREFDAEYFVDCLPIRERGMAEIIAVQVFDQPSEAVGTVLRKKPEEVCV